jgi:hypothetical protein
VVSLAEESLVWESADPSIPPFELDRIEGMLQQLLFSASEFSAESFADSGGYARSSRFAAGNTDYDEGADSGAGGSIVGALNAYAQANATALHLDPALKIQVAGFHSAYRVGRDGQLLIELVAQFTQQDESYTAQLGGLPLRGGTTIVAAADGRIRYVISKPLPSAAKGNGAEARARERLDRQRAYLDHLDMTDPGMPYLGEQDLANRMRARMSLLSIHQGAMR